MRTQAALFATLLLGNAVSSFAVVTITPDSAKSVMRREKGFEEHPVSMKEEQVSFHAHSPENDVAIPEQTCNDDFPLGTKDSNNCTNLTHHRPILDEGMCMEAAKLAGAGVEHNFFAISQDFDDFHPKGCFAWKCGHTHEDQRDANLSINAGATECYYYNGNGDDPKAPKGYPVCYRADYLNGSKDTNGGCDANYSVIMDEVTCRDAAECLGFAKEAEFRVGEWNFSKHNEYPKGCFIRTDTGSFQFNNISSLEGEPANPQIGGGIPVCNITVQVHWTTTQTSAAAADADTAAAADADTTGDADTAAAADAGTTTG